jgi:hypothetical protein
MTKKGRDKRIQARLNKATYPMIITGWKDKHERIAVKAIGIETVKQMQAAAPLIRQRIKDQIIRGTAY